MAPISNDATAVYKSNGAQPAAAEQPWSPSCIISITKRTIVLINGLSLTSLDYETYQTRRRIR